jgi:D-alanine-D-alanine ligase
MSKKTTPVIAVVCGGPSAEAEVSRSSARGVAEALRATYANVVVVELDRSIGEQLQAAGTEVVFPILHGPPGEDGTFQGFLETIGLPYVGSGVCSSAFAIDKVVARQIFREHGLRVARGLVVRRDEEIGEAVQRVRSGLGLDVVVKPASQGSAVGASLVDDPDDLEKALEQALAYEERVLVEERIHGREITAAVLERNGIEVLPIIEVRTPPGSWYDYEHRYTEGLSEHLVPAPLPDAQYHRVEEMARVAHRALGCRDLSRADFVVPEGEPVLLEVNTLPGMTPTSLYPDAAQAGGLSFADLVAHFVEQARSRAR